MSNHLKARLLVVDDDKNKVETIIDLWNKTDGPSRSEFIVAQSTSEAMKFVRDGSFDLLVLDLMIPRRKDLTPDKDEAKRFLEDLHQDESMRPPREVIILSSFAETLQTEREFYNMKGWTALHFGIEFQEWRDVLIAKLQYIKKCVIDQINTGRASYETDYCIISALRKPELNHILSAQYSWQSEGLIDATEFYRGECKVKGDIKRIVCGNAFGMGMVHGSLLSFKAWHYFRPRFIVMIGMTAGVRGATNMGDILIAEDVWDYGAGKVSEDKRGLRVFIPDPRHVSAEHSLSEALWNFGQNNIFTTSIENGWPAKRPDTRLSVRKGPIASGAAVVANSTVVEEILSGNRKLLGLEMEAYGVYSACQYLPRPRPRYICVKSVCDFADGAKSDDFQDYASYTSSEFIRRAIEHGVFEAV